jgi:hypothetical protein
MQATTWATIAIFIMVIGALGTAVYTIRVISQFILVIGFILMLWVLYTVNFPYIARRE